MITFLGVHKKVLLDKVKFTLVGLITSLVMLLLVPLEFMGGPTSIDL